MSYIRPDWLPTELYPFTIHDLDLPAGSIRYLDEGTGPTLLFVHAGMWSFIFRDAIRSLRSDFRCITFDFPGYGLSPDPEHRLTVSDMVEVTAQFIDRLDLQSATLVAHDVGGPVSVAALEARSDRIAGLVLTNTFLWTPDTRGLRAMLRIVGSRPFAAFGTATNLVPRLTSGRGGVGRHLDPTGRRAFLGPYRRWGRRWGFHAAMRSIIGSPEVTEAAWKMASGPLRTVPTLTIFGEKNDPFGFQNRHGANFTDHEPIIVKEGNHFPMMDDPAGFASEIRSWHARRVATTVRTERTGPFGP